MPRHQAEYIWAEREKDRQKADEKAAKADEDAPTRKRSVDDGEQTVAPGPLDLVPMADSLSLFSSPSYPKVWTPDQVDAAVAMWQREWDARSGWSRSVRPLLPFLPPFITGPLDSNNHNHNNNSNNNNTTSSSVSPASDDFDRLTLVHSSGLTARQLIALVQQGTCARQLILIAVDAHLRPSFHFPSLVPGKTLSYRAVQTVTWYTDLFARLRAALDSTAANARRSLDDERLATLLAQLDLSTVLVVDFGARPCDKVWRRKDRSKVATSLFPPLSPLVLRRSLGLESLDRASDVSCVYPTPEWQQNADGGAAADTTQESDRLPTIDKDFLSAALAAAGDSVPTLTSAIPLPRDTLPASFRALYPMWARSAPAFREAEAARHARRSLSELATHALGGVAYRSDPSPFAHASPDPTDQPPRVRTLSYGVQATSPIFAAIFPPFQTLSTLDEYEAVWSRAIEAWAAGGGGSSGGGGGEAGEASAAVLPDESVTLAGEAVWVGYGDAKVPQYLSLARASVEEGVGLLNVSFVTECSAVWRSMQERQADGSLTSETRAALFALPCGVPPTDGYLSPLRPATASIATPGTSTYHPRHSTKERLISSETLFASVLSGRPVLRTGGEDEAAEWYVDSALVSGGVLDVPPSLLTQAIAALQTNASAVRHASRATQAFARRTLSPSAILSSFAQHLALQASVSSFSLPDSSALQGKLCTCKCFRYLVDTAHFVAEHPTAPVAPGPKHERCARDCTWFSPCEEDDE
uniref:Uncharacterized protein n=1 Tax=Sexangularia sp. CB-2014 TaxID=1486929 RepID=A0A7S1VES5_9EUKA